MLSVVTNRFAVEPREYAIVVYGEALRRRGLLLAASLVVVIGLLVVQNPGQAALIIPISLAVSAAAVAFNFTRLMKRMKQPQNRVVFSEMVVTADDQGFRYRIIDGPEGEISREELFGVTRRGENYLVYLTPASFLLVPRRAFANEGDEQRFGELLR